ncbi:MAG: TolC family protein [Flavobacteriales bacterium]|nr:TolC family protein [Flavobacteriales bacterium]
MMRIAGSIRAGLLVQAIALGTLLHAQVPATLTRDAFVRIVLENHPMATTGPRCARIWARRWCAARGGFDPVASAARPTQNSTRRTTSRCFRQDLKVPWYGIDLLAGYEQGNGDFLNPQQFTPNDGLVKAGLKASLGQGLFIDERRAALRRAQAYQRATEGERRMLLNALLLQALNDHADWVAAQEAQRVNDEAVGLAMIRLEAVRGSWRGGDRPAIDTLEAYLQYRGSLDAPATGAPGRTQCRAAPRESPLGSCATPARSAGGRAARCARHAITAQLHHARHCAHDGARCASVANAVHRAHRPIRGGSAPARRILEA